VLAVTEAERARDALERQVGVLDHSSHLQQLLLAAIIEGGGLTVIARTVAVELRCEVGVYGPTGDLVASHCGSPAGGRLPARLTDPAPPRGQRPRDEDPRLWARPVFADGDRAGYVVLVQDAHPAELMEAVAGHTGMACSLALLRERAASRARTDALEQILWDLLQGSVEHRVAARTRAAQLGISLSRAVRVVLAQIDNVEEIAGPPDPASSQADRVRRDVLRAVRTLDESRGPALVGLQGDLLAAVVSDMDGPRSRELVDEMAAAVRARLPGLRVTWGVSRGHADVVALPGAVNEARTALAAARRLGGRAAYLYDELGIERLLLGDGTDPDLRTFMDDVAGPLLAYDRANSGGLIDTLRAFFDADCSQRAAAERLFVHPKTLRYRLERVRQLTGLDLSRHEDRMRADLALRLLRTARSGTGDPG
jgi:sugar diacid utilization regulator